jgi:hypothetical protein
MYCPHCGQQQVSREVRFCSRCGFPLIGVAHLLSTGGSLPNVGGSEQFKQSPKQRGIRQGVFLWLIGAFIVPLLAVILPHGTPKGNIVGAAAIICFVGGLVRFLYALLFQQEFVSSSNQINLEPPYAPPVSRMPGMTTAAQLPPPASTVQNAARRIDTGELITPPPSVTDHTTQLLGEKQTPRS